MTTTILIAIAAFLAITLVLVALLLYAKAKLTSSGDVTIDINDGEKVLTTESGSTLLVTLANNNVFLPSACGGGGDFQTFLPVPSVPRGREAPSSLPEPPLLAFSPLKVPDSWTSPESLVFFFSVWTAFSPSCLIPGAPGGILLPPACLFSRSRTFYHFLVFFHFQAFFHFLVFSHFQVFSRFLVFSHFQAFFHFRTFSRSQAFFHFQAFSRSQAFPLSRPFFRSGPGPLFHFFSGPFSRLPPPAPWGPAPFRGSWLRLSAFRPPDAFPTPALKYPPDNYTGSRRPPWK